jgi:hypothetical protein
MGLRAAGGLRKAYNSGFAFGKRATAFMGSSDDPPEIPEEVRLQALDAVGDLANSLPFEEVDAADLMAPLDTPDVDWSDTAPIDAAELMPDAPGGEASDPGLGPFPVEEVDPADAIVPLDTPGVETGPSEDLDFLEP